MQTVDINNKYSSINLTTVEDNFNLLNRPLKQYNRHYINIFQTSNIFENGMIVNNDEYDCFLFFMDIQVEKDIGSNIKYYKFDEVFSANDPMTYIQASNNSLDHIIIVWYNKLSNKNYNKLNIFLTGYDNDDNQVTNYKVTGYIYAFAY